MSQMSSCSEAFIASLTGSFKYVVRADIWSGWQGVLLTPPEGLPVVDGTLTITDGQAIRSNLSLTIADPEGLLRPLGDNSAISPYGPEVGLWAGIDFGSRLELLPLGRFPITDVQSAETWRLYSRAGEATPTAIPSGQISLTASDRALYVQEAKFEVPTQPAVTSSLAEIARLLNGIVPWLTPQEGVTDATVPGSITYSDDRMGALQSIADNLNADPIADPYGNITLFSRDWASPVWVIQGGEQGVLVSFTRQMTRNGVYNAAIVTGADASQGGAPRVGRAYQSDGGPLSYRPGFRLPYFSSSPLMTNQSQVDKAAATTLARVTTQKTQVLTVTCTPNPAISAGDVVTIQAPRGQVDGRIQQLTLPLKPARMQLSCVVDSTLLGMVA